MTKDRTGLDLQDVRIALGAQTLVEIDAVVAPGAVLTVMGPSGSGKSSLLAFIGGFLDPAFRASGRVVLGGRDVTLLAPQARRIGLLFQDALLFSHMSVADNLLFGLDPAVRGRQARWQAAEALLARVELPGFGARDPATLSGGQQTRIALARTLLANPAALLLDEPFARLDTALRQSMRRLVFDLVAERRVPAILVTHDHQDADAAGGPVVSLGAAS